MIKESRLMGKKKRGFGGDCTYQVEWIIYSIMLTHILFNWVAMNICFNYITCEIKYKRKLVPEFTYHLIRIELL